MLLRDSWAEWILTATDVHNNILTASSMQTTTLLKQSNSIRR